MVTTQKPQQSFRIHLTNITGLGAVRLLQSLLPSLINSGRFTISEAYIPAIGELSDTQLFQAVKRVKIYKRFLPNPISRFLECTILARKFKGPSPLLVFGDIPVACNSPQIIFVQSSLLNKGVGSGNKLKHIKYLISRWLFRRNLKYVSSIVVQTEAMKTALATSYPQTEGRIHVIGQPAPKWLIDSRLKRESFNSANNSGLRLFYPAAFYPHKNHRILAGIRPETDWPVSELLLTIPEKLNPNPLLPWLKCWGELTPKEVITAYKLADALLFLSLSESLGFPLIEAMWIGLPIICPDLPYARVLCGDEAIYFDPADVSSMKDAIQSLCTRRASGWWPNWARQLKDIPADWQGTADSLLKLVTDNSKRRPEGLKS